MDAGTEVDRYIVRSQLGAGGMATVYAVEHAELGSMHALKVLSIPKKAMAERLMDEGRLQASLRHPHIVSVNDVIEVDGCPALVMELVDGMALDEWIEVNPDADEATRMKVAREVIGAVGYAHAQGLIHRDLKPANVMVSEVGGEPFAKVADFGLAKALDDDVSRTRTGIPMGTPRYMAPEQIKNAKGVDHRADVFALGCLLHELWTGAPVFDADSIPELFMDIASGEMPDLQGLPDNVASAVGGALIRDREARIQSCEELLEVLEGEREPPPPPPPRVPPSQVPAARPLVVAGLGVSVAGVVALVVLALGCGGLALWWTNTPQGQVRTDPVERPAPRVSPKPSPDPAPAPRTRPRPSPSPSPSPSPEPAPAPSPKPKPAKGGKGKGKGHNK